MNKPLVILTALTICCCITSLQAISWSGCRCPRTVPRPVPIRVVNKIEVIPASGRCRSVQRIIHRLNGSKVCIDPDAAWFPSFVRAVDRKGYAKKGATSRVHRQL
ncbi:C-X-C motif chemokine 10 isoform 2-T2 [Menidia menidia]